MKFKQMFGFVAAMAIISAPAFADSDPLTSEMKAFVIESDASGTLKRNETEEVEPGDTVEYELTYRNVSDAPISGLIVSAPVPSETAFVPDSAMGIADSIFEVSVDNGETWTSPPVYREGDAGREEIPASEYDLVRWLPQVEMPAGEEWRFGYRVNVE